jgi:succinate dehydrogenase (ubiquinone) flavoprotein subunit
MDKPPHGAGEEMKPGDAQPELPKDAGEESIAHLDKLRYSKGSLSTAQIRGKMQRVMQVPLRA